jgi:hypothetical protein
MANLSQAAKKFFFALLFQVQRKANKRLRVSPLGGKA